MSAGPAPVLRLVGASADEPAETPAQMALEARGQALWRAAAELSQGVGAPEAARVLTFQLDLAAFLSELESSVFPVLRKYERLKELRAVRGVDVGKLNSGRASSLRFGELLRTRREMNGLSRAKLARRTRAVGEGLSEATIKLIETGKGALTRKSILLLMNVPELALVTEDVAALLDLPPEPA